MKCVCLEFFLFLIKSCQMTRAYFSFLPPLKQKFWGNFHDYERALVTTEQEKHLWGKTHFSLRIVERLQFCIFIYLHVVNAVVLLYIIGYYNYFFGLALYQPLFQPG